MVYVHPERGPDASSQTAREKEETRQKILKHWENMDDAEKKDRAAVVRRLADKLDIPKIVIEQHLAEWESGKSA